MTWKRYVFSIFAVTLVVSAVLYAWVLLVDPYDNVPFSPALERAPVSTNQRYSYPALARSPKFDSTVTGSSSVRLLRPKQLNELFDASFVNLSMDSGLPYEQAQLLTLFARHHPQMKYAILGVDWPLWCEVPPKITERGFPHWMYDDNAWNDLLYLFNFTVLEMSLRQAGYQAGLVTPVYDADGYRNFLPPASAYDLAKVQRLLYKGEVPHVAPPLDPGFQVDAETRAQWTYPTLEMLRDVLTLLPESTQKILLVPPSHHARLPRPGSQEHARVEECKSRIATLAGEFPNTVMLDFAVRSDITLADENFWDRMHYTVEVADVLAESIARGHKTRQSEPGSFEVRTAATPGPVSAD